MEMLSTLDKVVETFSYHEPDLQSVSCAGKPNRLQFRDTFRVWTNWRAIASQLRTSTFRYPTRAIRQTDDSGKFGCWSGFITILVSTNLSPCQSVNCQLYRVRGMEMFSALNKVLKHFHMTSQIFKAAVVLTSSKLQLVRWLIRLFFQIVSKSSSSEKLTSHPICWPGGNWISREHNSPDSAPPSLAPKWKKLQEKALWEHSLTLRRAIFH